MNEEIFIKEAKELCRCVLEEGGIMSSVTLKQLRRVMNLYEGKPLEGKYADNP